MTANVPYTSNLCQKECSFIDLKLLNKHFLGGVQVQGVKPPGYNTEQVAMHRPQQNVSHTPLKITSPVIQ
jgi:hypothetical protein